MARHKETIEFINSRQKGLTYSKMSKENIIKKTGLVVEARPNAQFLVELDEPKVQIRCYLAGKMNQNKIKVLVGDKVEVEITPTQHLQNAIGRITFRNK